MTDPSSTTNKWIIVSMALTRIFIIILSYRFSWPSISWSAGFQAAFIHPNMNWQQLKQDYFVLLNESKIKCVRVMPTGGVSAMVNPNIINSYVLTQDMKCVSDMTKTPPLIMVMFYPFWLVTNQLNHLDPDRLELVQHISVALFIILIDSIIAWILLRIGEHVITSTAKDINEEKLEQIMDPRIAPPYSRLMGFNETASSVAKDPTTTDIYLDSIQLSHTKKPWIEDIAITKTVHEILTVSSDSLDRSHDRLPVDLQEYYTSLRVSLPTVSCRFYCCNPIVILSSLFSVSSFGINNSSLQSILYLLVLCTLYSCMKQASVLFTSLCIAAVLSINRSLVFTMIPLVLFYTDGQWREKKAAPILFYIFFFYACFSGLLRYHFENQPQLFELSGSFNTIPNLGLLWYFNIQLFPTFRNFYQNLHSGVPFLCIIPLCLRLKSYPLELFIAMHTTYTLLKSDPTICDFLLGIGLMVLCPRSWIRMSRISLIAVAALPVPIVLFIITYGLWIESATGNANYIYFQCLALNILYSVLVLDFIGATVTRDKALRVTKKAKK